jgi:CVNH domain
MSSNYALRSLSALSFVLLYAIRSVSASDCSGGNLPQGTYRQSCSNCSVSGSILTAKCDPIKSTYNQFYSTLDGYGACRSGIENFNGYLTCDKGDAPAPPGSYRESCRDIVVEKGTLYAKCRNVGGEWKESAVKLNTCNQSVYNYNGALECILPLGTYQHTCRNAHLSGGQLTADCKSKSGSWITSSVLASCRGRDLNNNDGRLGCN